MGKWKTVMEKRSNRDGLCGEQAGEELRFVKAGGQSWKLNLLGWMVCSWDQEIGAKRVNNRVMRMTFKK